MSLRSRPAILATCLLIVLSGATPARAIAQTPSTNPPAGIDPPPVDDTPTDGSPGNAVLDDTEPAEDPTAALEAATARLAAVSEGADPGSAAVTSARSLVEILQATVEAQRKLRDYQSRIDAAPKERAEIERRKAELDAAPPESIDDQLGLDDLKTEITRRVAALNALREEASGLASTVERRQSRRSRLRAEAAAVADRLDENESRTADEVDHREQRIARRRLEARVLETERTLYDSTDDLLRNRQRLLAQEIDAAESNLARWNKRARALESQDLKALLRRAISIRDGEADPLVTSVAARNVDLAERLLELNGTTNDAATRLAAERTRLGNVRRSLEADRRRFAGRVTPEIATVLRQRDAALPSEVAVRQSINRLEGRIPTIELECLLLEDELARLSNPAAEADRLLDEARPPLSAEARRRDRPRIIDLLEERVEAFGQPLIAELNRRVDELNGLLDADRALLVAVREYRDFVLEETLWVRDTSALDGDLARRLRTQFSTLVDPAAWIGTGETLRAEFAMRPSLPVLGLMPAMLALVFRRSIARRTKTAGERVGRAATDGFRETLVVVGFAILNGLAFAGPAWMVSAALDAGPGVSRLTLALDHTMVEVTWFLFALGVLGAVLRRGGLGERHFQWSPETLATGRRLVVFAWISVLFAFGDRLCGPQELDLPDLGRLFYTPIPLLLSGFFLLTLLRGGSVSLAERMPGWTASSSSTVARASLLALTALPLIAVVTANLGWYEATSLLQRAILRSILFLVLLLVLREILYRGLHAYQRSRSWSLRRQREGGEDVADEEDALADISERTRRAIRFCVITLLLAGSWGIWSRLVPAFNVFGDLSLWSYAATDASGEDVSRSVGVGTLLVAVATIFATMYAARNVPTVVEVLFLDRFDLERGVKYAVSQLVQWVVVIGGIVFAFSMVGINWQSVQWLAAGFTVGLGFGLQEIFANFISGLIILFEQPVRVGDVVTVGQTTGRISRIRMRSTTITDWDRKELVVPNKQFITQEVVNWSIGESCIRLVLPVGVSYGDDPERVIAILQSIGAEDPETLQDPPPNAHFAGFGDSSLDFELRVYLPDTEHLVTVRNRINTAIKRAFDDRGITIPFPQRDVHIDMVSRVDPENGPAAPIAAAVPPRTDPNRGEVGDDGTGDQP